MAWLRRALFYSLRLFGGFAVAQRLTRGQLRILCYHGFSIADEHLLAPYVFMRTQTFERRMRILRARGLPVISLEEAITRLRSGGIARAETVITFDDGWASTLAILPILREYKYPACIYITTEHLEAGTEAFNVTLTQMLHASRKATVTLRGVHPYFDGEYSIGANPAAAAATLIAAASRIGTLSERQRLLPSLAAALGVDYVEFMQGGRFRFLSREEIASLPANVDVQLHTHTHSLPDDSFEAMANEVRRNKNAISELTGIEPTHLCYPSGAYSPRHPEWLARLDIKSATTCDPGLNGPEVPLLLLKRHLDSEHASDIEFEAEITGVRELLRKLRTGLRRLRPRKHALPLRRQPPEFPH